MTAQILEMAKIEQRTAINGRSLWCVVVLSPVHGRWIVQGEHVTKQAAEQDLRNWR